MILRTLLRSCFAFTCAALVACSAARQLPAPAGIESVGTRVRVVFPHSRKPHGRSHYVSASTKSVVFALTSVNGGSVPSGFSASATVSLAFQANNSNCTYSSVTQAYTCSTAWVVPAANDAFTVTAYDGTAGTGSMLSRNVLTKVVSSGSSTIAVTLDGIPSSVTVVPATGSTITGSVGAGFVATKCGSPQSVDVYALDADGNDIVGAGAPAMTLTSGNTSVLTVATPAPATPNLFTLTYSVERTTTDVQLTAGAAPLAGSGGSAKSATPTMAIGGGTPVCGTITNFAAAGRPTGIATGPDGNLWFTELNGDAIGRITTAGTVTVFSTGLTAASEPSGIAAGPDGNLWFAECSGNKIGRITTAGVITEYSTGISANSAPLNITTGPDGNLWFTEFGGNRIGRITTTGTITEFSTGLSASAEPNGIAKGPDGNLWFTEFTGNRVAKITTTGTITEYSTGITSSSGPAGIVAGPDNNLWFGEGYFSSPNRLGRITTAGAINEFSTGLSGSARTFGVTVGPDDNLWFTEYGANAIAQVTTAGVITGFSLPVSNSSPEEITSGPDGALWFTEENIDQIGRLQ